MPIRTELHRRVLKVWRIGLDVGPGKERLLFWQGLAWTLLRRPRLLATYLSMPPLGYGFRRRCLEVFSTPAGNPQYQGE